MAVKQQTWEAMFATMDLPNNITDPINEKDFKDPYSKTIKAIFFLYSLECFLYRKLNWAARSKASSCIDNLGCFAAVLSKALASANKFREEQIDRSQTREFIVYRGLSLDKWSLNKYD